MTGGQRGETSPWIAIAAALVLIALAAILGSLYISSARASPVDSFQVATPDQLGEVRRILGRDRLPQGAEPLLGPSEAESWRTLQVTSKVFERAGVVDDGRVLVLSRLGHGFGGNMTADVLAQTGLRPQNLEYIMTDAVSLDLDRKSSGSIKPVEFGHRIAAVHPGTIEFEGRRFQGDVAMVYTACKDGGGFLAVYHTGDSLEAESVFDPVFELAAPCLARG
ncbi:hypothetical protein ABI59_20900 [Acidobacteria bacterium Mor1]|nr:hypothetical protein ABI59_20900 [Acidobacteria bacterium Mor1]